MSNTCISLLLYFLIIQGVWRRLTQTARNLKNLDAALVERDPSLYELVGQLDKLLHAFEGTKFREVLFPQRDKLLDLHKSIEEKIADWNLARLIGFFMPLRMYLKK